jgi:hypothetical protein
MKLSLKVLCAFSLIAVLIIVIFMNSYHQREGWTPKNGKDYYEMEYADTENNKCENHYYKYRVVGTDTNGKQRVRCYHTPGRPPK